MKKAIHVFLATAMLAAMMLTSAACATGPAATTAASAAPASVAATDAPTAAPTVAPDPFTKMPELVEWTTGIALPSDTKMPEGEDWENNDVQKWFTDNLNVKPHVIWTTSDQNFAFEQKINLLIAANDIPDVLGINVEPFGVNILSKLVKADMIQDMTQVYDDYGSATLKENMAKGGPGVFDAVTYGGKLFAIPSVSDVETAIPVMWTRQDWLDKAGLTEPQTLDDVETLVKAFQASNGAGPLPSQQNMYLADTASFDFVFGAYNAYPGSWIKGPDGSIVYGSVQPEVKAALGRLAKWYADGIIDKEFMLKDGTKAVEAVANGKAGIFMGAWWSTWWPLPDAMKNDPTAVWTATVLKGSDGIAHAKGYGVIRSFVVVKKGFKYPEAIMKSINQYEECSLKNVDWYNKLIFDAGAKYSGISLTLCPVFNAGAKDPHEITARYNDIMEVLDGKKDVSAEVAETQAQVKSIRQLQAATDKLADMGLWSLGNQFMIGAKALVKNPVQQTLPAFIGTTDLKEKLKVILEDMEKKEFLEIITGKKLVDDFDRFVAEWKAAGGDAIAAEINNMAGK